MKYSIYIQKIDEDFVDAWGRKYRLDDSHIGKWSCSSNTIRIFDTKEEAEEYGDDLVKDDVAFWRHKSNFRKTCNEQTIDCIG